MTVDPALIDQVARSLPPVAGLALRRLAETPGEWVAGKVIGAAIWGGRRWPVYWNNALSDALRRARPALAAAGLRIESRTGCRAAMNGGRRLLVVGP